MSAFVAMPSELARIGLPANHELPGGNNPLLQMNVETLQAAARAMNEKAVRGEVGQRRAVAGRSTCVQLLVLCCSMAPSCLLAAS